MSDYAKWLEQEIKKSEDTFWELHARHMDQEKEFWSGYKSALTNALEAYNGATPITLEEK